MIKRILLSALIFFTTTDMHSAASAQIDKLTVVDITISSSAQSQDCPISLTCQLDSQKSGNEIRFELSPSQTSRLEKPIFILKRKRGGDSQYYYMPQGDVLVPIEQISGAIIQEWVRSKLTINDSVAAKINEVLDNQVESGMIFSQKLFDELYGKLTKKSNLPNSSDITKSAPQVQVLPASTAAPSVTVPPSVAPAVSPLPELEPIQLTLKSCDKNMEMETEYIDQQTNKTVTLEFSFVETNNDRFPCMRALNTQKLYRYYDNTLVEVSGYDLQPIANAQSFQIMVPDDSKISIKDNGTVLEKVDLNDYFRIASASTLFSAVWLGYLRSILKRKLQEIEGIQRGVSLPPAPPTVPGNSSSNNLNSFSSGTSSHLYGSSGSDKTSKTASSEKPPVDSNKFDELITAARARPKLVAAGIALLLAAVGITTKTWHDTREAYDKKMGTAGAFALLPFGTKVTLCVEHMKHRCFGQPEVPKKGDEKTAPPSSSLGMLAAQQKKAIA